MKKLNRKSQEGFTIIEVMIVLAIAGLIMLIVFMAVPALQRTSRNTQRKNDASMIVAAINECLSNHNGYYNYCESVSDSAVVLNTEKLGQLRSVSYGDWTPVNSTGNVGASWWFGYQCDNSGTSYVTSGNNRTFMVLYRIESSSAGGGSGQLQCVGA